MRERSSETTAIRSSRFVPQLVDSAELLAKIPVIEMSLKHKAISTDGMSCASSPRVAAPSTVTGSARRFGNCDAGPDLRGSSIASPEVLRREHLDVAVDALQLRIAGHRRVMVARIGPTLQESYLSLVVGRLEEFLLFQRVD